MKGYLTSVTHTILYTKKMCRTSYASSGTRLASFCVRIKYLQNDPLIQRAKLEERYFFVFGVKAIILYNIETQQNNNATKKYFIPVCL